MRIEADDATRYRDRREAVPGGAHRALRAARAASPPRCRPRPRPGTPTASSSPPSRPGPRAQDTPATWLAAVTAWQRAAEPYPLSYALLRLAEALTAAGDLDGAARAVRQSHALAQAPRRRPDRRGGRAARPARPPPPARQQPRAPPGGQARRRGTRHGPAAGRAGTRRRSPADELARFGLTDREREVLVLVAAGRPTRRSPGSCSSARRPPACTSPTSSPSSASAAGSRPPRSPTAWASPASAPDTARPVPARRVQRHARARRRRSAAQGAGPASPGKGRCGGI